MYVCMDGSSQSGLPLSQKRCTLCTSKFANVFLKCLKTCNRSTDYCRAKGGLIISHLIIENTFSIFFFTLNNPAKIPIAKETRYRVPSVAYCRCYSKTEILNISIKN